MSFYLIFVLDVYLLGFAFSISDKFNPPRQKRPTNFQKGLNDRDICPDFYVLLFADYSVHTKEELWIC